MLGLASRRWYPRSSSDWPDPVLVVRGAGPWGVASGFLWLPRPGPRVADVRYWIYANRGDGGPVDLDRPVAGPLEDPGWVPASLPFPGEFEFVVRSFDRSGLCEHGLDSAVRLVLDGSGEAVAVS